MVSPNHKRVILGARHGPHHVRVRPLYADIAHTGIAQLSGNESDQATVGRRPSRTRPNRNLRPQVAEGTVGVEAIGTRRAGGVIAAARGDQHGKQR